MGGGEQVADAGGVGDALRHAALQRAGLAHERGAQRNALAARACARARAPQHRLQHVRMRRHVIQAAPQLHRLATLSFWYTRAVVRKGMSLFLNDKYGIAQAAAVACIDEAAC